MSRSFTISLRSSGGRIALLALLYIAMPLRAVALDLGDDGLVSDDTVANKQGNKKWDSIKEHGAERIIDRDRTMYQPDGLRAGNYTIFPTLGTTVLFDDNIYATAKDRVSDVRFEIVPVVRAKSNLPRHVLDFAVGAKLTEYARHEELNTADFRFAMDGALHFDNAHTLSMSVLSALEHEDRAAPEAPRNAAEKTQVFHNRAIVGVKRDAGRLWASFSTSIERWDFSDVKARDGTTIDQDIRDTQLAAAQLAVGYRFSPGFEFQAKLRTLRQTNFGATTSDFSAYGYEAVAGLAAEVNPLLRWRLMGGYGIRDYDNIAFRTAGIGLAEAEVQWLPTQLMTVYLTGRRAYSEGIDGEGAGGRVDNSISFKLEYEALRNLVFTFGGEYRDSQFVAASRHDRSMIGRVGADYYYTKNWLFSLVLEHEKRDSNISEDDLTRNRVWLTTKLRF